MIPVGEGSSCAGPSSVKKAKRFEIKKSGMSWLSGLGIFLWITVLYAAMFSKAKLRRARGALRCEATENCLGAVRLGVLHCFRKGVLQCGRGGAFLQRRCDSCEVRYRRNLGSLVIYDHWLLAQTTFLVPCHLS